MQEKQQEWSGDWEVDVIEFLEEGLEGNKLEK